jgi:glycosyltransferase involved in cell wall biosynthesis
MTDFARVWMVIPAFNEARHGTIADVVRAARCVFPNIVVVDDASQDSTGELALREGAHVCRHPVNLGQGAALATGIRYALMQEANEIITFDADGQHTLEDAQAMVRTLRAEKVDVVLGSRFLGAAVGISGKKRLFLRAAAAFTRVSTGLSVTDTHNGLRVLSRSAAAAIVIRQNRMAHASEILHQIADLGLSYVEAPTRIIYTSYSVAKGQKMSGVFAILGDLLIRKFYR